MFALGIIFFASTNEQQCMRRSLNIRKLNFFEQALRLINTNTVACRHSNVYGTT